MYCPECQTKKDEEGQYCSECGTKLIEEQQEEVSNVKHCDRYSEHWDVSGYQRWDNIFESKWNH